MHGATIWQLQLEASWWTKCKHPVACMKWVYFVSAVIPDSVNHVLSRHQSECFHDGVWFCLGGCRSVESALWGRTLQTTEGFVKHIRFDVSGKSSTETCYYFISNDKMLRINFLRIWNIFFVYVFTGLSKVGGDGGWRISATWSRHGSQATFLS